MAASPFGVRRKYHDRLTDWYDMKTTVYFADVSSLADRELFEKLLLSCSADRREKVERLRFEKDKRLSLGVAALLSAAMRKLGERKLPEIVTREGGKPCFKEREDVYS